MSKHSLLFEYKNGNCCARIFDNGTRTIFWPDNETKQPQFPFNIDCKITNSCDSKAGCMAFCHEQSNPKGRHGDLQRGVEVFSNLPSGIEIAVGGGNVLSHPDLISFLKTLKKWGLIANLTINQYHFTEKYYDKIHTILDQGLVGGIGCSITNSNIDNVASIYTKPGIHLVFHLIAGIHTPEDLKKIIKKFPSCRVLILGYKHFGNGVNFYSKNTQIVENNLFLWRTHLHEFFKEKGLVISFDNLALEQLKVRRFLTDDDWRKFYQGEDGEASLYIDLVKNEYAQSSRSPNRFVIDAGLKTDTMLKNIQIRENLRQHV